MTLLPKLAVDLGINKEAFETCLASGKYKDKVDSSIKDGVASGLQGTPYSVIVTKNGKKIPLPGTQSYEQILKAVDLLVK